MIYKDSINFKNQFKRILNLLRRRRSNGKHGSKYKIVGILISKKRKIILF
jgi:hypothetical protein